MITIIKDNKPIFSRQADCAGPFGIPVHQLTAVKRKE
jgi:hypothetical protein